MDSLYGAYEHGSSSKPAAVSSGSGRQAPPNEAPAGQHAVAGSTTEPLPNATVPGTDDVRVRAVENILAAAQLLRADLEIRLAENGLNGIRFSVLKVIRDAAPAGCTQNALADSLGQSESSISALVDRMRAGRLIYRLRCKADRRKRLLMLTDEGRQVLDRAEQSHAAWANGLLDGFDANRLQLLESLLGRVLDHLSDPAADSSNPASRTPLRLRLRVC